MKQICEKCRKMIVMHSFIESKCKECDTKIITSHIPAYRYCNECAEKLSKCKQCGTNINN